MGRRRKPSVPTGPRPNDAWVETTELQINGRYVSKGTEVKIKGERGRFRFIKHVKTETTEWIDVWGGPKGAECMRSFRLEQITRVHYKNQTTENLAAEYKAKKKAIKAETEENSDTPEE